MSAVARGRPVFAPGFQLDRYELLCVLSRGGTAIVWLARTRGGSPGVRGREQLVAVKTIQPEHADNERFQQLLVEEARVASNIQDPHVVRVLDLGQVGEVAYLVMELVDGESLRALMHGVAKKGLRVPPRVALRLAWDVTAGLAAAHALAGPDGRPLGIVHRDVSPENVLVAATGHARLIDFGFAKATSRAIGDTTAGAIVGRPQFLAPEVAMGKPADDRADIWSTGALLYYMLSGRPPYDEEGPLATHHALTSRAPIPPLPAEIPEAVRAVVDQALAHDRDKRFSRASAMHRAVETSATASGGLATRAEVAAFLALVLEERIAGRKKAIERALAAAAERERVNASLMAPPEIPPAGEEETPERLVEASEAALRSLLVPSSNREPAARDVESKVDTLRPPATEPFPVPAPPPAAQVEAPQTERMNDAPIVVPPASPAGAFPPEQGTQPYGSRPPWHPPLRSPSRPPLRPPSRSPSRPPSRPPLPHAFSSAPPAPLSLPRPARTLSIVTDEESTETKSVPPPAAAPAAGVAAAGVAPSAPPAPPALPASPDSEPETMPLPRIASAPPHRPPSTPPRPASAPPVVGKLASVIVEPPPTPTPSPRALPSLARPSPLPPPPSRTPLAIAIGALVLVVLVVAVVKVRGARDSEPAATPEPPPLTTTPEAPPPPTLGVAPAAPPPEPSPPDDTSIPVTSLPPASAAPEPRRRHRPATSADPDSPSPATAAPAAPGPASPGPATPASDKQEDYGF